MNKKGFELAISTLILIILGLVVLIALIYAIMGGFKRFDSTRNTLLDSVEGSAFKTACDISCKSENYINFCCKNFTYSGTTIKCGDDRLQGECSLSCSAVSCLSGN